MRGPRRQLLYSPSYPWFPLAYLQSWSRWPPRLFWFLFGSATATMVLHSPLYNNIYETAVRWDRDYCMNRHLRNLCVPGNSVASSDSGEKGLVKDAKEAQSKLESIKFSLEGWKAHKDELSRRQLSDSNSTDHRPS